MNCFSHSRLSRLIGIRTKQTMADCPMRILGFEARFFCDVVFIFYAMREIFFFFFLSGMPKISKNNKNSNLKNANFHMRPVTSSALIFVMPAACLCGKIKKKEEKHSCIDVIENFRVTRLASNQSTQIRPLAPNPFWSMF